MIISAIKDLERAMRILNDIPTNIDKTRASTLSSMNDLFEDFYDHCDQEDKVMLKKVSSLKKDVMGQVEEFCAKICADVKEEVRIVEE